jgi:hypothetical protein
MQHLKLRFSGRGSSQDEASSELKRVIVIRARESGACVPRVALAVAECDDRVFRIVVPDS